MKLWVILLILLFLPFYVYILSKSISLGKISALRMLGELVNKNKEETRDGKEKEKK